MDVCSDDMKDIESNTFELILDKATLDCLLCRENAQESCNFMLSVRKSTNAIGNRENSGPRRDVCSCLIRDSSEPRRAAEKKTTKLERVTHSNE